MGSVQEKIVCPQCGSGEAIFDYFYKTGEEYTFCPLCGYRKAHSIDCDEMGNWIMQTDVYEVDGKTVGYSKLEESEKMEFLSDFTPFTPDHAAEELENVEKRSDVYIVKLDAREKYGFHYLSFWYSREIKYENGKAFLYHKYPVFKDREKAGKGMCFLAMDDGIGTFYDIRNVDLGEMLHVVQRPEYKESSYITKVEDDGQVKVLAGRPL